METFDAVIVGGGPAGSTCARHLHRAGLRVAVVDRSTFPRDKVCAGWITPPVLDLLDLDLEDYQQGRVLQPITAFRLALMDEGETETHYTEPVSFGIRRCEFDHYLLQRSGARLRCGEPVSDLRRADGRWIVNGKISTPILIGAGGHFCPVGRRLNPQRASASAVAALEMEVPLRDDQLAGTRVPHQTPLLHFCADLNGYGWCFRKGNFLNIGLGRQDPHDLPRHTRAFLASLVSHRIVPADLPVRFKGHAYLLADTNPRRCVGDGVLLAGDAAGLAEPHSGEGIRPAVESGVMAADAVLTANGRYDVDSLAPYQQHLRARFAATDGSEILARTLSPRLVRRLATSLMGSRWLTRHVVLDRWFLGRHRSPLNPAAWKALP